MQGFRLGPCLDEPAINDISGTKGEISICPRY